MAGIKEWYGLWIDGQEVESVSKKSFEVENPATGAVVARVAEGNAEDVAKAVAAAKKAFDDGRWSELSPKERGRILLKASQMLRDKIEDIVQIEVASTGRAIKEMRAQIPRMPEWLEYFGSLAMVAEGGVTPFGNGFVNYYRRLPLGVVAQITPWNHPLLIAIKKVAPALAAGNSIVVKPSELAPIAVIELARILTQAGVPAGVINVVPGFGVEAGKALCEHPDIAKIDLTGGTPTGRHVAAAAGRNLAAVTTELGGKAPLLVFDDVDLDTAINTAAFASFIATGQTCVAATRILVHRPVFEEFQKRLVQKVSGIRLGDPFDPSTQLGPLISSDQRARVESFVASAIAEGATILTGGARPAAGDAGGSFDLEKGYYYRPTLIGNCHRDMKVVKEEVFGPVVVLLPFEDEQDAISLANDSPFGLAAAIFTRDLARAHRVASKLRVGIIWINDYHKNDPSSPWGGLTKESGIGRENGWEAYHQYTQTQSVVVNYAPTASDWFNTTGAAARYN